MKVLQSHIVPPNTPPERLSDYARKIFTFIPSRKGIKKAILRHEIIIDGQPAQTGSWVQPHQKIEWIEKKVAAQKVFPLKLEVIFEDEYLALINKPAGTIVSGNQFRTIENALPHNLSISNQIDKLSKMRAVHRLDSPTSGLLLIAKTAWAHLKLAQQFERKTIHKRYQAIVIGDFMEKGNLNQHSDGKPASTDFRKIKSVRSLKNNFLSLVDLYPKTGRTHQLRIHLSKAGFPILGDDLYGKEGLILRKKGLFLCATELHFFHPKTEEELKFEIQPPAKFNTTLEREKRRWETYNL